MPRSGRAARADTALTSMGSGHTEKKALYERGTSYPVVSVLWCPAEIGRSATVEGFEAVEGSLVDGHLVGQHHVGCCEKEVGLWVAHAAMSI